MQCDHLSVWLRPLRLSPALLPRLQHHPRAEGAIPHVADGGAAAAAGGAAGGRIHALHHHQTLRLLPVRHQRDHVTARTLTSVRLLPVWWKLVSANHGAGFSGYVYISPGDRSVLNLRISWWWICCAAFTGSWERRASQLEAYGSGLDAELNPVCCSVDLLDPTQNQHMDQLICDITVHQWIYSCLIRNIHDNKQNKRYKKKHLRSLKHNVK